MRHGIISILLIIILLSFKGGRWEMQTVKELISEQEYPPVKEHKLSLWSSFNPQP